VVIGIKQNFVSDEYAQMIESIILGALLMGMHETALYGKDWKGYPVVGASLQMLSYRTSSIYEVVGKPSRLFYESALGKLRMQEKEASFDKITIISNDVKGDLVGA
jgi:NagD protein